MSHRLLTEGRIMVSSASSPTVRRRQLGMELRRLREAAGKTQEEAAAYLELRDSAVSRHESGKAKVSVSQLRDYLELYGVGSPESDHLLQLCREAQQRGWFARYGRTVPDWFRDYLGMETAAAEVWTWEPLFIPGLLQCREYTEALSTALNPTRTPGEIERIAQLRVDRQQRLTSADDPLILRAVIGEAALHCEVGDADVMQAQLAHLIEASKLPNVTLQVIPFAAGAHRGMRGAFTCLRFPEEPMNTVYLELYWEALYVEAPGEVTGYTDTFEGLTQSALSSADTGELIGRMIREK